MNQDILAGKIKEHAGKIKEKWGKLTDDDLKQIQGRAEVVYAKLQQYYGMSKEQAQKEINDLFKE